MQHYYEKIFYENGNVKYEGYFLNGKADGKGKEYYHDGDLKYKSDRSHVVL